MKILVTGSSGQLGSELCRGWDAHAEVVGLDLPEFDLTDRDGVLERLARIAPRVVINTAATTDVDRAESEPARCRAVNADGVAYLVEACRRLDAVLVQVSTDYVFGSDVARRTPYVETDVPGPLGVYGRTKLDAERHAAGWPKHLIVRTAGLYGRLGPSSGGNFPHSILRLARGGRPLYVVDDQHTTPSYVPHVAQAIRFLVATGASGTYHVAGTGQTTWYDFAVELLRQAGLPVKVEPITTVGWVERSEPHHVSPESWWGSLHSTHPTIAPRPAYSVLDTSKYLALPGRPDMPPWQAALDAYLRAESG